MNHGDELRPDESAAPADDSAAGGGTTTPDRATPDIAEQDVAEQDTATADVAEQDTATPDVAEQDTATPDVAEQDIATPDIAEADIVTPNVAEPAPAASPTAEAEPATPEPPADSPAMPSPEPTPSTALQPPAVVQPSAAPPPGTPPPGTAPPVAAPPNVGARRPPHAPGRVLEGAVTAVSAEEVELTLDDGRAAVISRRNFSDGDDDPTSILSVGDRAFGAELARDDPKGRVVLSRAWALKRQAWDRIEQRAEASETIIGTVTSTGAKGVVVDVGVRGFVPSSHLELEPVSDLSSYKGQELELKVLECDPRRERLVLSRRSLLLKAQRAQAQQLLASLSPGDTCRGKVTSITNYGAFVDIGGVNGLVHLSELSWQRVRKPADVVSLGDELEVRVLDVKPKKRRVSLSLRQMQPDPLSELEVGEIRRGPVTRLVDFGAFVSLGEVEGLVHLSELAEYRVTAPEEIVTPGEEVGVKILSIDRKRRRIELSIRRAAEFGG